MPLATTRPRERAGAGFDVEYHALVTLSADMHPVARGHHMPLVGGHRLEQTPCDAPHDAAIRCLDETGQPVDLKHAATPGGLKARTHA